MDMSKFLPPLGFGVKNLQFVKKTEDGYEAFWMADVKVKRMDGDARIFEKIIFFEQKGNAAIHGMEYEDGYPLGLMADFAIKQQEFIQFLRDENQRVKESRGLIANLFEGNEYAQQARVIASYIVQREVKLNIGVGCTNEKTGKYELFAVDSEEDGANNWIEDAKSRLSFDELG